MKKLILFTAAIFMVMLTFAQFDLVPVWVHCHDSANAPAWFTDGSEGELSPAFAATERGIVYNPIDGYLYVSSRHAEDTDGDEVLDQGEPHVYILDPLSGEAPAFGLSQLLTMDITSDGQYYGGGYPLNNVTVDESGQIFACNMTLASGPDIVGDDGAITVKAFRVYRWDWQQGIPQTIIDYKEGGYRLGDKFSIIGNWDTQAYIYAGAGETTKLLRWSVTAGVVAETPEIVSLGDIESAGTSITVAPVPDKDDWIYVSGKGFLPTLFNVDGTNLSQVALSPEIFPASVLAGRTIEFGGQLLMTMWSSDQSAFVLNISKHGENVTDVDVIGFTPVFGTKYDNAYGEGAVEFGVIDGNLYVYACGPSNGLACFRVDGLNNIKEKKVTNEYQVSAYPNPATSVANIAFELPQGAKGAVSVKILDMSGRLMRMNFDKAVGGKQELQINTAELSAGTYVYQVIYDSKISTGKLTID